MKFIIWKDSSGQWRWSLKATNNKIIATSGESFYNESDCRSAIELVKASSTAPVIRE
jgi:uncharacterized protein YegP (UPF0339 family)